MEKTILKTSAKNVDFFLINFKKLKKTLKYNKLLKKRDRIRLLFYDFLFNQNYFFNNLGKND